MFVFFVSVVMDPRSEDKGEKTSITAALNAIVAAKMITAAGVMGSEHVPAVVCCFVAENVILLFIVMVSVQQAEFQKLIVGNSGFIFGGCCNLFTEFEPAVLAAM